MKLTKNGESYEEINKNGSCNNDLFRFRSVGHFLRIGSEELGFPG